MRPIRGAARTGDGRGGDAEIGELFELRGDIRRGGLVNLGYGPGVGTRRDAKPSPPAPPQPVDRHALDAALRLFVATFVVDDKRSQIHKRLLASERRLETLASLPRWIAAGTAPLEGADRSPAGLRARLGDLLGIRLTEHGASRTTIARALELDRGTSSVFIADSGHVAMITVVDGPPILCSRLGTVASAARRER